MNSEEKKTKKIRKQERSRLYKPPICELCQQPCHYSTDQNGNYKVYRYMTTVNEKLMWVCSSCQFLSHHPRFQKAGIIPQK
jgi:hypothetical protein